jgi:hypothetical protein
VERIQVSESVVVARLGTRQHLCIGRERSGGRCDDLGSRIAKFDGG